VSSEGRQASLAVEKEYRIDGLSDFEPKIDQASEMLKYLRPLLTFVKGVALFISETKKAQGDHGRRKH
jgi:hypothetical protein